MADHYDDMLILGYVEGDLEPQDVQRMQRLMAADPQLRMLVEQLAADRALLRSQPEEQAPAQIIEQVHACLERQILLGPAEPAVAGRIFSRWYQASVARWAAYAAVAALLLISVAIIIPVLRDTTRLHRNLEPVARHQPPHPDDDQPGPMLQGTPSQGEQPSTGPAARLAHADGPRLAPLPGASPAAAPRPTGTWAPGTEDAAKPRQPATHLEVGEGEQYARLTAPGGVGAEGAVPRVGVTGFAPGLAAKGAAGPATALYVQVATADPRASRDRLVRWAHDNHLEVVTGATTSLAKIMPAPAAAEAPQPSVAAVRPGAAPAPNGVPSPHPIAPAADGGMTHPADVAMSAPPAPAAIAASRTTGGGREAMRTAPAPGAPDQTGTRGGSAQGGAPTVVGSDGSLQAARAHPAMSGRAVDPAPRTEDTGPAVRVTLLLPADQIPKLLAHLQSSTARKEGGFGNMAARAAGAETQPAGAANAEAAIGGEGGAGAAAATRPAPGRGMGTAAGQAMAQELPLHPEARLEGNQRDLLPVVIIYQPGPPGE